MNKIAGSLDSECYLLNFKFMYSYVTDILSNVPKDFLKN